MSRSSTAKQLTVEVLKELNKRATGKAAVVVKPNELQSALDRPGNLAHYVPKSTDFERAASLSFGIITNHPFHDGNKRTGELAANEYLKAHGYSGLPSGSSGIAKQIADAHKAIASKNGTSDDDKLQSQLAALYKQAVGK